MRRSVRRSCFQVSMSFISLRAFHQSKNAAGKFQRALYVFMFSLKGNTPLLYLDDIAIFSAIVKRCMDNFREDPSFKLEPNLLSCTL